MLEVCWCTGLALEVLVYEMKFEKKVPVNEKKLGDVMQERTATPHIRIVVFT